MKSTFILSILSLGSLLSTPKFVETYDQYYTQAPMHQTPRSKNYIDVAMYSSPGVMIFKDLANLEPIFPINPAIGFAHRTYPKQNSSIGFETEISLSYVSDFKNFAIPIVEWKGGPLFFMRPTENDSNYIGCGIGIGFPRVVPIYVTFGREFHIHETNSSKVELQLSTTGILIPELMQYATALKLSYGFGF